MRFNKILKAILKPNHDNSVNQEGTSSHGILNSTFKDLEGIPIDQKKNKQSTKIGAISY